MAINERDVRHVAELARLGLDPRRIPSLVAELNGILGHMEVLAAADRGDEGGTTDALGTDLRLRPDAGPPQPLAHPREALAPEMRDGFFVVPRLASHETHDDEMGAAG